MDIIQRFEDRVFHYGLIIAIIYRLVRLVHEFMIDSPSSILLLGAFNLLLFVVVFFFHRSYFKAAFIVFYLQMLVTSILTWNNAGGWNGGVPYLLLVAMVAIVITSHGFLQVVSMLAYGVVIFLFSFTTVLNSYSAHNNNYSLGSSELDFFLNTVVLILITYYLKENFFSFRESVERTNVRLKLSSEKLMDQTGQLHVQQGELNILRNDLEKMILGKVNESQKKAEILKEYAFVNSHHVRASLARVLGLIDLIEIESKRNSSTAVLNRIKKDAQEIDGILKKIDTIIE
jgi:signal transduction histidine kinase